MAILQIRNLDDEVYSMISEKAKNEKRSISSQASIMLKKTLEQENAEDLAKQRRINALKKTMEMDVPKEAQDIDFVKLINAGREERMQSIYDSLS